MSNIKTKQLEEVDVLELTDKKTLVLFNDDVNTFEHVIETLVQVCGHNLLQAEQCTFIIHYNGKCAVKNGTFEELKPMYKEILDRGISAEIQ